MECPDNVVTLLGVWALLACSSTPNTNEGYLASSDGVRIFYRVVGSGPDTIVAIHGGPGGEMNNIAPDLEPLAEHHTVIYYDQRGGGRSTLPADTNLLHARHFVEDLEALRQHFRLERMNLLAHSFGPVLAASYAQAHPDRVARMIFLGAIGPRKAEAHAYGRTMYARMDSVTRDSAITLVTALLTGEGADAVTACRAYERLLEEWGRTQGDSAAPRGSNCTADPEAVRYSHLHTSQKTVQSLGEWDYTTALRQVTAPLLVIYGERDPSPISSQRAWAAAVPNGRLLVISGAPKAVHVARPDIFFPAVDSFLAGKWPESSVTVSRD